jgi:hypothetical protein
MPSEVRIRASESKPGTPSLGRRLGSVLLAPLFGALLLVPIIRRQRRKPQWVWWRLGGCLAAAALLAAGWGHAWAESLAAVLMITAAILPKIEDPQRVQKAAERLGSQHVVNGGFLACCDLLAAHRTETQESVTTFPGRGAGSAEWRKGGTPLWLFLSRDELIVSACAAPEQVVWKCLLINIDSIHIDSEIYRPQYVSFAKAPPVRDEKPSRGVRCLLTIRVAGTNAVPAQLQLEYRGAFARHLAEVAAHAIHSCRDLARRTPADQLRVID